MSVEHTNLEKDSETTDVEVGGFEQLLKKYILPTVEDLWAKLKIETSQSITMGQTLFYTLEHWVSTIRESKVYAVTTTSLYYMGGFLFKSTIVEPTTYFFGWFPKASAHWVKTVSVKFYTELSEISANVRDYLVYPGVETVVFVNKSLGSVFYVFGIPVLLSYKTIYGMYYLSKEIVDRVGNDVYYSIYSTKLPEDDNDEEENNPEENTTKEDTKNTTKEDRKSLGWNVAEIALPAIATAFITFSIAMIGVKLIKRK